MDSRALNRTLPTLRLRLEPLGAHHALMLFDAIRHPAIYEWISLAPPANLEWLEARWARVASALDCAVDTFDLGWAVQRVEDGAWIGKLDAEVHANGVASNVGYLLVPEFWRRGYAAEAVRALCDHLAGCGVIEQRATVTLGNLASERVLERAGFARSRILPGNDTIRGVSMDDVEFIRRDE